MRPVRDDVRVLTVRMSCLLFGIHSQEASRMGKKSRTAKSGAPVNEHLSSQVAVLRKKRRWTLAHLSALSGVSRSMLSQIERNRANPTLTIAYRIAKAFDISLDEMIDRPVEGSQIERRQASDPTYVFRSDYDCRIRMLTPEEFEKDVEFYEVVVFAGKTLNSAPHLPGTREIIVLKQGAVRVTCGSDTSELESGDSAHYTADKPHSLSNPGQTDAVLYMVNVFNRG